MQFLDRIFGFYRAASQLRLFWLGVPLLLYSWTITGPLLSDDLHMILKCERYFRGESQAPELFRFAKSDESWNALRAKGIVPWWMPEQGRQDFFRPLSEWSFVTAVRLFGRNVIGHRLMSLAVFAGALIAVHWMIRRSGADSIRAGVATFFFGISQTVAAPTIWMCNRSDLLVVMGAALSAGAYWSAWNRPRAWHPALAAGGFILSLLAKEVAIALPAVIVGHELLVRRRRHERFARPLNALIALVLCVIALVYVGYYRFSRPWVFDLSGTYAGSTVAGTSWWLSLLLYPAVWTIGFPIDALLTATMEQNLAVATISAALLIPTGLYLRKSARGDSASLFFCIWVVLFVLPGLKAFAPSARYICTATVGWAYLLSGLIVPAREEDVTIPRLLRHWFLTANGVVSAGCVIGSVLFLNQAESSARNRITEMFAGCSPPMSSGDMLLATQADSIVDNICSGDRLEYLTGLRDVALIYLLPPGVEATTDVEDDRTLMVRAGSTSLLGTRMHKLAMPRDWRPQVGQTIRTSEFTAEIAGVRDDDFVYAMRVRFNEPLTSARLHFYPASLNAAAKAGRPASVVQAKGS